MANRPLTDDDLARLLAEEPTPETPGISVKFPTQRQQTPPPNENNPNLDNLNYSPNYKPPPDEDDELTLYHKAFESEFTRANEKAATAYKDTKELILLNATDVAERMIALALGARSEMVRFNASKWVIEFVKDLNTGADADPFTDLINQLQANTKTKEGSSEL